MRNVHVKCRCSHKMQRACAHCDVMATMQSHLRTQKEANKWQETSCEIEQKNMGWNNTRTGSKSGYLQGGKNMYKQY